MFSPQKVSCLAEISYFCIYDSSFLAVLNFEKQLSFGMLT